MRQSGYHQERSNNPIDDNAEGQLDPDLAMSKYPVQGLKLDFAQYGIHHDQKAHR